MNKKEYLELINLCNTLLDAENMIDEIHDKNQLHEHLTLCQEAAITIGSTLESNGFNKWIPMLEDYCENIYQESLFINSTPRKDEFIKRKVMIEKLNKEISKIEIKKEVIFLPYKVSMWDCMESVWEAFKKRDEFEVYVVPIPYYEFDRNADELKYCYEGELFPNYVEVTHYKNYIVKERCPEIVFIHNPFDNYNLATSVAEDYFSYNLKPYVKQLVYIPYYVTGGTEPESHGDLPVYKQIDFIVTQSPGMTDKYVKLGVSRDKILALGSPKVDAVKKAIKYDRTSEPWRKKINGRRVYFLNTSITGLLENDEVAIEKMKKIMEVFKRNKEVVLLWRPHPLLEAVISGLRPGLKAIYEELKESDNYDNIIIDYTPDISRAVAISDAYIGEETSSVVHLFGAVGKPIYLLNMKENHYGRLSDSVVEFIGAEIMDNKLWFSHCNFNGLCSMDLNTGKTDLLNYFSEESLNGKRLHRGVCKIDEETLYFAPHWGNKGAVYNINPNIVSMEPFDFNYEKGVSKILDIDKFEENLFMIPTGFPAIIKYSCLDKNYTLYDSWTEKVETNHGESFFWDYTVAEERFIYCAAKNNNTVLKFDCKTGESENYYIKGMEKGISSIDYSEKKLWMTSVSGQTIVEWDTQTLDAVIIDDYDEKWKIEDAFFSTIACNQYVFIFPKRIGTVLKINKKTHSIAKAGLYEDEVNYDLRLSEKYSWNNNFYFVKKISSTSFIAMRAYDGKIVIYNEKTDTRNHITPFFSAGIGIDGHKKQGDNLPYAMRETLIFSLKDFIDNPLRGYNGREALLNYGKVLENIDKNVGNQIAAFFSKG